MPKRKGDIAGFDFEHMVVLIYTGDAAEVDVVALTDEQKQELILCWQGTEGRLLQ